jgi:hypothetical protein
MRFCRTVVLICVTLLIMININSFEPILFRYGTSVYAAHNWKNGNYDSVQYGVYFSYFCDNFQ